MNTEESGSWIWYDWSEATDSYFEESSRAQIDETSKFEGVAVHKVLDTNRYLVEQLVHLTKRYQKLTEESNDRISSLEREIARLRQKMDEIRRARTLTVKIPKSWVIDEEQ